MRKLCIYCNISYVLEVEIKKVWYRRISIKIRLIIFFFLDKIDMY